MRISRVTFDPVEFVWFIVMALMVVGVLPLSLPLLAIMLIASRFEVKIEIGSGR